MTVIETDKTTEEQQNLNNGNGGEDGAANGGGESEDLNLGLDDLEEFDPENLTPEQAKKLVEKLKEAKTRGDKYKSRFVKGKLKVNDTLERKDKEWESKVDEVVSKKLEETTFFTSNPEAAEHKEDIYKIAKEKNLSLHEAYKVVMFDKISDPAYQARLRAGATAPHGSAGKGDNAGGPFSNILGKKPAFLSKLQDNKGGDKK